MAVYGTSASAPVWASIISLVNDARIASGKPPLGFLNPLVWSLNTYGTAAFNDITVGNNPGCGTEGFNVRLNVRLSPVLRAHCLSNSQATAGWDPVTGWGTPNFGILKDIVLGL